MAHAPWATHRRQRCAHHRHAAARAGPVAEEGLATLCIGGGETTAIAIELV